MASGYSARHSDTTFVDLMLIAAPQRLISYAFQRQGRGSSYRSPVIKSDMKITAPSRIHPRKTRSRRNDHAAQDREFWIGVDERNAGVPLIGAPAAAA